jgi:hypothetical protein
MGTKEAGARGHEEDEAGAGWCCSDWAGERITGTGRRGGQGSGGSGTGDTAIRCARRHDGRSALCGTRAGKSCDGERV